jgi:adenosylmethionine-8-amino-7-oxononanoate aminotransferase
MTLAERDRKVLWHPFTQMQTAPAPLEIVRGEGVWLETSDGRRLLDGISSWWVNIHGHSHPKLNAALAAQAQELEHVIFAGCTHRPAVELAEALLQVLPPGLARVFYSDNGSTAVEVALKMALQYWSNRGEPRRRFLALRGAYHGDTVGAMSASARGLFTAAFEPLLFEMEHVATLEEMRAALQRGDVAAVILEPMIQGAAGMRLWSAEFLRGVRALCDTWGALLIADEVFTGFGRTGRMFACEHAGISPDLICLSKGLTAGYLPLGATVTTEAVYEAFLSDDWAKTFFHGHSYTANPLACAVACASLRIFQEQPVLERVARLERQLQAGLAPLRRCSHVTEVRVLGGVGAVELAETPGFLERLRPRLVDDFLRRGLLLRPLGRVFYFMPPYVITEAETEWALEQIRAVLGVLP